MVKDILKDILYPRLIEFKKKTTPNALTILVYHRVGDEFDPAVHVKGGWTHRELFERNIKYIVSNFKTLPLRDAVNAVESGLVDEPLISITVDDGDISVRDHIIPILEKYNCPATFFINSSYTSSRNGNSYHYPLVLRYMFNSQDPNSHPIRSKFDPEVLSYLRGATDKDIYNSIRKDIEQYSYLLPSHNELFVDLEYLSKLDKELFQVGLHGYEHQRFSMMPLDWQIESLEKDIGILSELPNFVPYFALPFGGVYDWNNDTVQAVTDLNLKLFTCRNRVVSEREFEYGRIIADGMDVRKLLFRSMPCLFL